MNIECTLNFALELTNPAACVNPIAMTLTKLGQVELMNFPNYKTVQCTSSTSITYIYKSDGMLVNWVSTDTSAKFKVAPLEADFKTYSDSTVSMVLVANDQ